MKRLAAIAIVSMLAFVLAGCSCSSDEPSENTSESTTTETDSNQSAASTGQDSTETQWTSVATAGEAAKGAGFDAFGVIDQITLHGIDFGNPSFTYADGVARAVYDQPASMLDVRKADGKHSAPLTDRDKGEFAATWTQSCEDLEVTLYGAAEDSATVIEWIDGTKEYGVTIQGLGGEELSMTSDEVAAVVKGIKDADGAAQAAGSDTGSDQEGQPKPEGDPGIDFNQAVLDNGLGEYDHTGEAILGVDGVWYWPVYARAADGVMYVSYFDTDGNYAWTDEMPAEGEVQSGDLDGVAEMSEADVEGIILDNGIGEFVSAEFRPYDGEFVDAWYATTIDADGNEIVVFVNDHDGTCYY